VGTYEFSAEVWEADGPGAWHFVSVPEATADEIEQAAGRGASAFGSVRVVATIGGTEWRTSIFPDKKRRTYVLPLKQAVRIAEDLTPGTPTTITLHLAHP
jgi:hypothetical protein